MKQEKVMVNGPDLGRYTTLRAIRRSGVILNLYMTWLPCHIMDVDLLKKDVYKDEIYCKKFLLNMIWNEEIPISAKVLQWRCVESKVDNECFHYGWFTISPFRSGQTNTVGIVVRKALLGGVKGTCITHAKSKKATHE
jgi:DNA-directed RNA polymerase subunit alpha